MKQMRYLKRDILRIWGIVLIAASLLSGCGKNDADGYSAEEQTVTTEADETGSAEPPDDADDEPIVGITRIEGEHCSLIFDTEKWEDVGDIGLPMVTVCRAYIDDPNINFNVTEVSLGLLSDLSSELYEPLLTEQYKILGYDLLVCKDITCGDHEAVYSEVAATIDGAEKHLGQVTVWENGYQFCFSFSAPEESYDTYYPEFMAIAETIKVF